MTFEEISYARSETQFIADDLHLALHKNESRHHWLAEANRHLEQLAAHMGYTLTPIAADLADVEGVAA